MINPHAKDKAVMPEAYPDWIRTQQLRNPFHAPKKVTEIYRKTANLHAIPHVKAVVIAACMLWRR
jgi:hypothetical protein